MTNATVMNAPQSASLAGRLREAPLPVAAALRLALQIADALRAANERGIAYGALDPGQISFPASGPAVLGPADAATAYVAPEVLEGRAADARSDVFVFACLTYHLLTGRHPFGGQDLADTRCAVVEELPAAIESLIDSSGPVPADKYAGLVRLIMNGLTRNPEQRLQRMQLVYMELKLQSVAARRAEPVPAGHRDRLEILLREEIARVENAVLVRVGACDQSVSQLQRAAAETRDRVQSVADAQQELRAAMQKLEQGLAGAGAAAVRLESGVAEAVHSMAAAEEAITGQISVLEQQVRAQDQSIEALHTTVSQTDDLLERVVESFDSLQSFVLEHAEDKGVLG